MRFVWGHGMGDSYGHRGFLSCRWSRREKRGEEDKEKTKRRKVEVIM